MTQGRFNLLISELRDRFPDDWWIKAYTEAPIDHKRIFSATTAVYSDALDVLDDDSWVYLRGKAVEYFPQNTERRGKQPFFNVLNEVLAYKHLHQQGFSVSLLRAAHESRGELVGKRPDIGFSDGAQDLFCEVKTISSSEEELDRYEAEEVFSGEIYAELSPGFLNKLTCDIHTSVSQFPNESRGNLTYVIMNFDDWIGIHYDRYKEQIRQHLVVNHGDTQVYCRAGVCERFNVHHVPAGA